ncbi:hypothetical protein [Bacillus thuringiensis]|uniref:hypothetical protein n=1 Tax=Bacillus thuringiensis TaxID=1428 RepID=UPI0021B37FC3|nr:hypothetical protein [Bacillus thuringiensis]
MALDMYVGTLSEGDTYIRSTNKLLDWSGADHIHDWFVKHKQVGAENNKLYKITKKDLEDLLIVCNQVMENRSLASTLLPLNGYIGSPSYNESYFDRIDLTIEAIEFRLEHGGLDKGQLYYKANW